MLRASAACEAAGIPTASLICEGFVPQPRSTTIGLGVPHLPTAVLPGHVGTITSEQLRRNTLEITAAQVIANLTETPHKPLAKSEFGPRDIIFRGDFEEVNRFFIAHELSDGLPVVPPTRKKVEAFLRYTARDPDEVLGVILPDSRAATIWSVAVNGVMAGCRPEYMPILVALAEAMVDPQYGVQHSGNTPGSDTLITLNGPIIKELGFNYTQGALRDGFQPNTSIGRFWRLYLRNIAGFLPHKTGKGTFGNTWRVVLAENEDALAEMHEAGWTSNAVELGFASDDNVVSIARYSGGGTFPSVAGSSPEEILPYLADSIRKFHSWQICFTSSRGGGSLRPLLVITPMLAGVFAKAGWSKAMVKQWLFENVRITALEFERMLHTWNSKGHWNLKEEATLYGLPAFYYESDDPQRLVPIVWKAEDYMIAVSGDPMRNNCYVLAHNGYLGYPTGKKIALPENWQAMLEEARR